MQGQRSHLAQAKKCHERWQEDLNIMRVQTQNLSENHSNDVNHSVGIGGCRATVSDSNADQDANTQVFLGY
jgi:hypothetical protein